MGNEGELRGGMRRRGGMKFGVPCRLSSKKHSILTIFRFRPSRHIICVQLLVGFDKVGHSLWLTPSVHSSRPETLCYLPGGSTLSSIQFVQLLPSHLIQLSHVV